MVRLDGTSGTSRTERGARRPPNYLSARFQFRILTLVAALVVVMVLMRHARQPANWRWLWAFDQNSEPQNSPGHKTGGSGDESSVSSSANEARPTAQPSATAAAKRGSEAAAGDSVPETVQRVLHDGWKQIRDRLPPSDQDLLRHVLFNARHGIPLSAEQRRSWIALAEVLLQRWHIYLKQFLATTAGSSSPLSPPQQIRCRRAAEQCLDTIDSLRPALIQAAGPTRLTPAQRQQLDTLQGILDQIDWQQVADNTPLGRSAEYGAWYRVWERLEQLAPTQLRAAAQTVTYTQLFAQPNIYRNRLVRFQGTVRYAYRAQATSNLLGIGYYYVMSVQLQPTDAENVRVYCRNIPSGFPPIGAADDALLPTRLAVPVEITGYFFKRAVYRATDGLHLCPVVLGEVTRYAAAKQPESRPSGPTPKELLIVSIPAALFAVAFSVWVYRRTRRRKP